MAKRASVLLEHINKTSQLTALTLIASACLLPMYLIHAWEIPVSLPKKTAPSVSLVTPILPQVSEPISTIQKPFTQPPQKQQPVPSEKPVVKKPENQTLSIIVAKGDTLGKIFKKVGLSAKQLQLVIQSTPQSNLLKKIKPGQSLVFTIKKGELDKLVFPYSPMNTLIIEHRHNKYTGKIQEIPSTIRHESIRATVRGSLYATAKRKQIPFQLIQQMTTILGRKIDFKKGTQTGDHFHILYEAKYVEDRKIGTGGILAVRYVNKGRTHEAVRYTQRDGATNYYTPDGLSLKKAAYDRYPVKFSHIASPFSLSRYHPILHYRRPHYGIDLAAPMGTPIHAIGDGRIDTMTWQKGYGNMIKLHHNSMYSTIYGHLLRFEKGLRKGKFVKRGDIIGYVGQSGLASGPHCHFEFHKYQRPVNPITMDLPHADPVPHREMGKFRQAAKRFLAQLHKTPSHA